ncbi:MAG: DNA-processing protein DprA [Alphaproteobacteria bacterium]|nr:DNA-processing protein DprA [Alphaproteobacteria bacterium]
MTQAPLHSDPLDIKEKLAWLRLARTQNVGPITFYRLVELYCSPAKALEALPELSRRGGSKKPLKAPSESAIEKEYEALQKLGGDIVTAACPSYPLALGAIDDAPPVISVLGNLAMMNQPCIGMVGARNASINGRKMAETLARDLGAQGHVIVSGLARGIDTAAHKGALDTGTIAVVAGGLDIIYPEENAGLYEQIKQDGLIIAESPLGQQPFAASFPRRNRIVSGLSKGVVVVEATMRSGSLITARMAGEQGRDVYAVPGSPLDPRAQGPNHLIREGATLVRNAEDILEAIRDFSGKALEDSYEPRAFIHGPVSNDIRADESPPEDAQETILSQLSYNAITVDELIRACHLSISAVQTSVLELELAGRVKRLPGNRISLVQ